MDLLEREREMSRLTLSSRMGLPLAEMGKTGQWASFGENNQEFSFRHLNSRCFSLFK